MTDEAPIQAPAPEATTAPGFNVTIPPPTRDYRKELWVGVAIAIASSANAVNSSSMISWADRAVAEFDRRFKE